MSLTLLRAPLLALTLTAAGAMPASCPGPVDPTPTPTPAEDIRDALSAIPGLTIVSESPTSGGRFFTLTFTQPADHADPAGQTFEQRLTLIHKDEAAPMVLYYSGYNVSTQASSSEPTRLLDANQLSIEHRFFEPSRPDPANWDDLRIAQASADFHRITQAFKGIYGAAWINTGGSKGGMTALFHRRAYPEDLDGTVAYVAPISTDAPDDRFLTYFAESVGTPSCQADLQAFQREALSRREALMALYVDYAAGTGLTYDHLGLDLALEHAVLETPFAFWQYGGAALCSQIPSTRTTDDAIFDFLDRIVGMYFFADPYVDAYAAYYHQASTELGYPAIEEAPVADLLLFPGTDIAPTYVDPSLPLTYDPAVMADVLAWIDAEGSELMLVYGEWDPWTAAAVELGGASDSYRFTVPEGNHGSSIGALPPAQQAQAKAALERWAGVSLTDSEPSAKALTWSGETLAEMRARMGRMGL